MTTIKPLIFVATCSPALGIITQLDIFHTLVPITGRDMVYDPYRDVLLASVGSAGGPVNGNSIVEINPATGQIIGSTFAGSEPGKIALTSDGSRLYVGVDGSRGFRWIDRSSGTLSPIVPLNGFTGDPSIAQSIAPIPGSPNTVAISLDSVASSASGFLNVFENDTPLIRGASTFDADQLAFVNSQTLITYEDSSTGFNLIRWSYDNIAKTLTQQQNVGRLVSGFTTMIEISQGDLLASTGARVDPNAFVLQGTYPVNGRVGIEQLSTGEVLTLGANNSTRRLVLSEFDPDRFLALGTLDLGVTASGDIVDLIAAGPGKLAYRTTSGEIGLISGLPVPEPSSAIFVFCASLLCLRRKRK